MADTTLVPPDEEHETYVYGPVKSRYHWRCLTCPAKGPDQGFRRRRDADDAANDHTDNPTPQEP